MDVWNIDDLLKTSAGKRNKAAIEKAIEKRVPNSEKKRKATENTTTGEVHDEILFFKMLEERNVPIPRTEYEYACTFNENGKPHKFRADYAWPEYGLLLEIQGGVFLGNIGRHSNPVGHIKDMHKQNLAVAQGYRVLQCTPQQLIDPAFVDIVREAFLGGWELGTCGCFE